MTADPTTELVAMGDIFADKLNASYSVLSNLTNPDKELSRDMDIEVQGTSETAETVQKRVKVDRNNRVCGVRRLQKSDCLRCGHRSARDAPCLIGPSSSKRR